MVYAQECAGFAENENFLRRLYSRYAHGAVQKELQKKFDDKRIFD